MVTMTGSTTETSAGLMRLAADGDEVAFAGLVDAHHADMSSVCFVVTGGDVELTEEAVQSAWPIAWRKLHTIRDPERLRPWLISIAVNEARQLARRRRRGRVLEIVGRPRSVRDNPLGSRLPCRRHRPPQCPRPHEPGGPRPDCAALCRGIRFHGAGTCAAHEPLRHPRSTGPTAWPSSIGAWRWMT